MNEDLFCDLRRFAEAHNVDIPTIRALDSPHAVVPGLTPTSGGQPLSRVVDKIFYSPKRQSRKSL
jgi:hypothetical protein